VAVLVEPCICAAGVQVYEKPGPLGKTLKLSVFVEQTLGVVAETMVALVLAAEAQRKFGGDSLPEFVRNARSFIDSL
jgi:chorismate synthase